MRIGIFGSGIVATTIGTKLVALGHAVRLRSRSANSEKAAAWARGAGPRAPHGSFTQAAAFGPLLFNCTSGAANLDGKVLVDVAIPLDFSGWWTRTSCRGRTTPASAATTRPPGPK